MTFSKEVRELASRASHGFCRCSDDCLKRATEFHHMLPNTKVNNNLYPLFLHSIFNCCPINHDCHMVKPKRKIREADAVSYEEYLKTVITKGA